MAAPTNTSALTAIDLGTLPASTTQNVHDAGTTYAVWYQFTAGADVTWVSVWGVGTPSGYLPSLSTWIGPASAPVGYLGIITPANRPAQLPVTPGTTYYLKLTPNGGNPTPAVLELSVHRGPRYSVPAGALAVNDDSDGFPLVFIDVATGQILNQRPFPAGEAGDVLPSGHVAVADGYADTLSIHDPLMGSVGTQPYPGAGEFYGFIRAHAASDTFYVGDRTTGDIRTINTVSVFGSTTWSTGADLTALAPNLSASLLRYANAALDAVQTWNTATNTLAGTFAPDPVGYYATDILTLADDTVLVNYAQSGLATFQRVIHYSAAGATLHTYNFTEDDLRRPAGTVARIASAIADPVSFWIWTHHLGGVSKFREIRISDGATLQTVTTTEFENGESQAPDGSTVRFGHSFSCTFWVVRQPIPDIDGPLGGGPEPEPPDVPPATETDTRYIRRLRRAPHVTNENTRLFVRRFELDLERGQGLATGQGSDPMVMLRLSRDGGQTWGEEIRMSAGRLGAYTQRVLARRLGHARDTVFEVTVSDPIAWSLVGAWLDVEGGTS